MDLQSALELRRLLDLPDTPPAPPPPPLTWGSLGYTLAINCVLAAVYVILFGIFSVQRDNARVYFTRWFVLDEKEAQKKYEGLGAVNLNPMQYLHALTWVRDALGWNEKELMAHAGLDMVIYLRMFVMAAKMFLPITILSCGVLLPVYITQGVSDVSSSQSQSLEVMNLANIPKGSPLFWLPAVLTYVFTFWILYIFESEFRHAAELKIAYTESLKDAPNQFTVLVRQVDTEEACNVPLETEKFFQEMHPESYLLTQACYAAGKLPKQVPDLEYKKNRLEALTIKAEKKGVRPTTSKGCCGPKVDAIEYQQEQVQELETKIAEEQERVLSDPDAVLPACFVSFRTRRGATVAAQTLQSSDPAKWITTWAPEPQDVVWTNLSLPYFDAGARKMVVAAIVTAIVLFFTIPVAFVQGLCNLSTIEQWAPWLKPVLEQTFVNAILQGFLPGLALTIFLLVLPPILLALSKWEGYVSVSEIDRAAAGKHFYFKVVTVFLSNVILSSAFGLIKSFTSGDTSSLLRQLAVSVPNKSGFFITFTLINGWVALAAELFRGIVTLIIFHLKNALLVVTPEDRKKAMSSPSPGYFSLVPEMEMYFLFSFVYMVIAPFYLPFVLIFFLLGYLVWRNQFINVYSPAYDLKGGFWPHFHARAISCLVISHIILILVLALNQNIGPAIVIFPLPVITLMVNYTLIFERYGVVFKKTPMDVATRRDKEDAASAEYSPRAFLEGAYLQECLKPVAANDAEEGKAEPVAKGEKEGEDVPLMAEELRAPEPVQMEDPTP